MPETVRRVLRLGKRDKIRYAIRPDGEVLLTRATAGESDDPTLQVESVIPQDPTRPEYRQGHTLGDEHEHWFRAKFFQQYRLFFRYHAAAQVMVFAWVNDEDSKRAYDSADDAYRVFRRMLDSGRPPSGWDQLLAEARVESDRLGRLASRRMA